MATIHCKGDPAGRPNVIVPESARPAGRPNVITSRVRVIFDPQRHHRHSIRLQGYDYSQPGAYFVTICVQNRECLLGNIMDGAMVLNDYGKIVESEWLKTAMVRPNVELDAFIVMPNHFHGVILITDNVRATRRVAPTSKFALQTNSLGSIMGQFKSIATKTIRKSGLSNFEWQRNYHEHIIRSEAELGQIRQYITENPIRWDQDENHPNR